MFLREDPAEAVVQQRVQCSTTQCNAMHAMQCSSRIAAKESTLGVFFGGQRHHGRPISPRDRQKEGSTTQGSAVHMELLFRKRKLFMESPGGPLEVIVPYPPWRPGRISPRGEIGSQ